MSALLIAVSTPASSRDCRAGPDGVGEAVAGVIMLAMAQYYLIQAEWHGDSTQRQRDGQQTGSRRVAMAGCRLAVAVHCSARIGPGYRAAGARRLTQPSSRISMQRGRPRRIVGTKPALLEFWRRGVRCAGSSPCARLLQRYGTDIESRIAGASTRTRSRHLQRLKCRADPVRHTRQQRAHRADHFVRGSVDRNGKVAYTGQEAARTC